MKIIMQTRKILLLFLITSLAISCSNETEEPMQTSDGSEQTDMPNNGGNEDETEEDETEEDENTDDENDEGEDTRNDDDLDGDGIENNQDIDDDNDGLIEIFTIEDLDAIRNNLSASGEGLEGIPSSGTIGFELENDLNFENPDDYEDPSLMDSFTTGLLGWRPIGISARFNAIFEGNEFTISNLFSRGGTDGEAGLFNSISSGAEIRNLNLEITMVSARNAAEVGGLVSTCLGNINNCNVSGSVIGNNFSGLLVGGLVRGNILNCSSSGNIQVDSTLATGSTVGGLIGLASNDRLFGGVITIDNCFSTASVSGVTGVGGLIGGVGGDEDEQRIFVSNCYATGDVEEIGSIGGLIGSLNHTDVESCYAIGNITGGFRGGLGGLIGSMRNSDISSCYASGTILIGEAPAGGLIGLIDRNVSIQTSFSYGLISNISGVNNFDKEGGLVGSIESNNTTIVFDNNYWDLESSSLTISEGDAIGLTTAELQNPTGATGIYETWDSTVWDFGTNSQYPALINVPNGLEAQRN